ncbi:MAG: hypothetical protein ACRC0X_09515, partial [Brevinema sp.]
ELFWQYIANNLPISQVLSIREAAGKNKDEVLNKTVDDKIFIPSHIGLDEITVKYKSSSINKIDPVAEERLKSIVLYYNCIYDHSQDNIMVTSTSRTAENQAGIVYNNIIANGGKYLGSMYQGNSGQFVEQELKKGTHKNTILKMLSDGIDSPPTKIGIKQQLGNKMVIFFGFSHIDAPKNTCDIGINNNPWSKTSFVTVLEIFINQRKFLNAQSLPLGKGKETDCHHLVILT